MISKIIQAWLEKRRTYGSSEASPNNKAWICQKLFVFFYYFDYKTTTANLNSSEYIMLEKTSFVMAQFSQYYGKNRSENNKPCFSAYSQYAGSGILVTKQIFGWHFFQKEIECLIECLVKCVNAKIDDQKYILKTVLQENIQKGKLQQVTNICLFQNIFLLFFKIFKLNVYVLVYYNKNLLYLC